MEESEQGDGIVVKGVEKEKERDGRAEWRTKEGRRGNDAEWGEKQ